MRSRYIGGCIRGPYEGPIRGPYEGPIRDPDIGCIRGPRRPFERYW